MPGAWTEGYWIRHYPGESVRLSFEIPHEGTSGIWPWMYLEDEMRFDVIKAQLDCEWLYVEWEEPGMEMTRLVALEVYE